MRKLGPFTDFEPEYTDLDVPIQASLTWVQKQGSASPPVAVEKHPRIRIDSPATVEVLMEWESFSGDISPPEVTATPSAGRVKASTAAPDSLPETAPFEPSTEGREDDHVRDPFSVPVLVETGRKLGGLDFIPTVTPTDEKPPVTGDTGRQHDLEVVKGVLWHACVITIDDLFEDLMSFPDDLSPPEDVRKNTLVLSELPARFADEINGFSARKFLTAVIDVTNHLTHQWHPLPTIAHALALRMLLNKTEQLAEIFTIDMPAHWRTVLEDNLYGDLNIEPLYATDTGTHDGRHHPKNGVALDFASWFVPLDPRQRLTPFTTT